MARITARTRLLTAFACSPITPKRRRPAFLPGWCSRKACGQADRAQAFSSFGEPFGQTNGRPTAYAGQHGDVLLAIVHIGDGVADDARRRMEFIQHLACASSTARNHPSSVPVNSTPPSVVSGPL